METVPDDTPPRDTVSVESQVIEDADDPFYGFDIDRVSDQGGEERQLALRLRNEGTEDAVVFAEAGAGEVFLDSVEAGSWSRVDLVTRGSAVTLRSARRSGETMHRLDPGVLPDSIIEVQVGDSAATP